MQIVKVRKLLRNKFVTCQVCTHTSNHVMQSFRSFDYDHKVDDVIKLKTDFFFFTDYIKYKFVDSANCYLD